MFSTALSTRTFCDRKILFCTVHMVATSHNGYWTWSVATGTEGLNFLFFSFFPARFSRSVKSNSLRPHGLQHARLPCPSPTPRVDSNSCPSSRWCHLILCRPLPLLPSIFPSIRVFSSESVLHIGGQSFGVSASKSVLPMNIQDWFSLEWTGWISLQSKGLSRVFSNTTV